MKKLTLIISLVLLAVAGFVACDDGTPAADAVTIEAAKQIALSNVGATAEEATFNSVETERKNGNGYYHIEVVIDGVKYEYKINTSTGDIVKLDINDQQVDVATVPSAPVSGKEEYIGTEAAKTAALTDAGIAAADAVFTEAKLDFDDGRYLYEVEFVAGGVEYEYELDAKTGAVYKKNTDKITVVEPTPSMGEYVGVEAAKAAAFADLGITAADATVLSAVFEVDNGVHVYEVELVYGGVEYEYEINARTGVVISKETDRDDEVAPSTGEASYIGLDAAKRIALAHAGFTAADVTFTEGKLDVEHGVYMYEIEFKVGGWEYGYEINASTGAIVDTEKEIDD